MKILKSFLLIAVIALGIVMTGCTTSNAPNANGTSATTTALVTPPPTTGPVTATPTMAQVENVTAIRTVFDRSWTEIIKIGDGYQHRIDIMAGTFDINYYRDTIIPETIAMYESVKGNLTALQPVSDDLIGEKAVLIAICDYKGSMLRGLGESEHGDQFASNNNEKARTIYLDAKYLLQNALDTLNTIPDPRKETAPLYLQKYEDMILDDKTTIQVNMNIIESKISSVT